MTRPTSEQIRAIYEGIDEMPGLKLDLEGWNYNGPVFEALIAHIRPETIIEVGCWKGASVNHMAGLCSRYGLHPVIYAVDVFVGTADGGISPEEANLLPDGQARKPTLYQQFLYNMWRQGFDEAVVPVWNLSSNAAKTMLAQELKADLIYIDASHDEDNVYADIAAYWPLLSERGVMFGDDWKGYAGVRAAVRRFSREHNEPFILNDWKWVFRAPWLTPQKPEPQDEVP